MGSHFVLLLSSRGLLDYLMVNRLETHSRNAESVLEVICWSWSLREIGSHKQNV